MAILADYDQNGLKLTGCYHRILRGFGGPDEGTLTAVVGVYQTPDARKDGLQEFTRYNVTIPYTLGDWPALWYAEIKRLTNGEDC